LDRPLTLGKGDRGKCPERVLDCGFFALLYARVAYDNVASRRALEKCGFRLVATERSFAEARSGEIEEVVLRFEESGSARGESRSSSV
jgi:L-amino acid N-acyltransferase YncA